MAEFLSLIYYSLSVVVISWYNLFISDCLYDVLQVGTLMTHDFQEYLQNIMYKYII